MTYDEIVAEFGPWRTIHLSGEIALPQPLDLGEHQGLKLTGWAKLTCAPGCADAVIMRGLQQKLEDIQIINAHGGGVRSAALGGHHVNGCHVNTKGHGYFGESGGGVWLAENHFNGMRSSADPISAAMIFGQWDTAFLHANLSESHVHGWRGGLNGRTANVQCSTITIDRSYMGLSFEPTGGGSIANCRFGQVWAAGQPHPADPGGGVAPVRVIAAPAALGGCTIIDLRASDFYRKEVFGSHPGLTVRFQEHY